ncbi:uncharacterized protein I206_100587 [Kwoniella pini CBS 10737]|uniref:BTB domain-containing protein n=1 Tax=Kwoniella pini CBS 10737 TaxID=1296096 RepID=A0A1B9ICQ7_9TREE|nr:uncharacterized protein I206_00738 [Kwoniella pini CBS 10737]OCF53435.1 hypothetical protein I206_00738 [Kwoniella pini CBS 10737]
MFQGSPVDSHYKWGAILLKAETGLVFRVHRELLAAYSAVFKNIYDHTLFTPPIICKISPKLLRIFLDLVYASNTIEINTTIEETKTLYNFCDNVQCANKIMQPIATKIYHLVKDEPWEVLIWAGERFDRKLAAEALKCMSPEILLQGRQKNMSHTAFKESLDLLPYSWRGEILYIILEVGDPTLAVVTHVDRREYPISGTSKSIQESVRKTTERVVPFKENWTDVGLKFEEGDPAQQKR